MSGRLADECSREEQIEQAFVFGSVANASEGPGSDIDLMVVGSVRFVDVVAALHPCHERLGREVNAVVMQPDEFRARRQDEGFVARVLSEPTLPILGERDVA